jgi:predicted amidohydrolase
MEDIRVAAVAMGSFWGKKEENLARMQEFVRQAARAQNARVLETFPPIWTKTT